MEYNIKAIEIRFRDIDRFDHVNNAVYFSYLEQARMQYFDHLLPGLDWNKQGIILAKNELEYLQPIYLKDKITIKLWCSKIGTKSFELSYSIRRHNDSETVEVGRAKTIMVCFDYTLQSSIAMPEVWKAVLEKDHMQQSLAGAV